jgi:hypothetical protein
MSQLVQVDIHLRMLCPEEGDQRIGSAALAENWAGILDRGRRVIRSGLAKTKRVIEDVTSKPFTSQPHRDASG